MGSVDTCPECGRKGGAHEVLCRAFERQFGAVAARLRSTPKSEKSSPKARQNRKEA